MDYKIKTTIEGLSKKTENKEGKPYIDKNGKEFTLISIKLDEDCINDKDFNGWCTFIDYSNDFDLNKGDTLEGYVTRRDVNDTTYWNFKKPNRVDLLEERVARLEEVVLKGVKEPEPEEEKEEEFDLPF